MAPIVVCVAPKRFGGKEVLGVTELCLAPKQEVCVAPEKVSGVIARIVA